MTLICQSELPLDMRVERALPGVQPLDMADWLHIDDVYAAQMQERLRLMTTRSADVLGQCAGSENAVLEAKDLIVAQLQGRSGFEHLGDQMLCPDGRKVILTDDPLRVMGALVQEDICLLAKPAGTDEHVLTAAILCFPALWTLSEKLGRPMGRIHKPVVEYDELLQRRVQRMFDGVKAGRPLWRFNRANAGAQLFQPRLEKDFDNPQSEGRPDFLRSERQSLIRLPESNAVLFSIHTYVIAQDTKKPEPNGRA